MTTIEHVKINKFMGTNDLNYNDYNSLIPVAKKIISNEFQNEIRNKYGLDIWILASPDLFDSVISSVWTDEKTLKKSCYDFIVWIFNLIK